MVVRGDDSLTPPPVLPIAVVPGEPLDTVLGVPLETGERVVVFFAPSHRVVKGIYFALGVLLLVALFGIVLILYGALYGRWHLRFVAITDRRVILQKGERPARWLSLKDIVDVRAKRSRSVAPGVVAPEATEASTALATNASKADPTFWADAEAIIVHGKKGALSIDESVPPTLLGPALANALYTDEMDRTHADSELSALTQAGLGGGATFDGALDGFVRFRRRGGVESDPQVR